jgi:hypothetical protein
MSRQIHLSNFRWPDAPNVRAIGSAGEVDVLAGPYVIGKHPLWLDHMPDHNQLLRRFSPTILIQATEVIRSARQNDGWPPLKAVGGYRPTPPSRPAPHPAPASRWLFFAVGPAG